jgi:hypothetical protein
MKMNKIMLVVGFAVFIVALVVLGPLATIWALLNIKDLLTGAADPWTWQMWLSILIMSAFFQTKVSVKK